MCKEYTTTLSFERENGEEIQVEVTFDGYIDNDDYTCYFELENIYAVIDEDGTDIVDELTDDEYENLKAICEEYVAEKEFTEEDE